MYSLANELTFAAGLSNTVANYAGRLEVKIIRMKILDVCLFLEHCFSKEYQLNSLER